MSYTYVTNIRHLMPEDLNSELPNSLLKEREFLGHIIKAGTSGHDLEFKSGIPCRKRVSRKPCTGSIQVIFQHLPEPYIYWQCTSCEDGGRLNGFLGTYYDLSHRKNNYKPELGERLVEVIVTRDEYKALLSPETLSYDPDSERIIYSATLVNQGVLLKAFENDMDNFIGFVASDANHENNRKRQKLMDTIYGKIQNALDELLEDCE